MNWWIMETAVALLIWAGVFFLLGVGLGAVLWRRYRTGQHAFMDERNDLKARNTALEEKVAALEEARGGVIKEGELKGGGLDEEAFREFEKMKLRVTSLQRALSTKQEEINALLETVEDREQETLSLEKGMAVLRRRMRLQGLDVELPVEATARPSRRVAPRTVESAILKQVEDFGREAPAAAGGESDSGSGGDEGSQREPSLADADGEATDPGPAATGKRLKVSLDAASKEDQADDDDFESDPDAETAPVPTRAKLELGRKSNSRSPEAPQKKPTPAVEVIDPEKADAGELAGAVRAIPLQELRRKGERLDPKLGVLLTKKPHDPDNLCAIRGVGAKTEKRLNGLGIYRYAQVASWSPEIAAELGKKLAFKDRIQREDWIGQAKKLLKKGEKSPQ